MTSGPLPTTDQFHGAGSTGTPGRGTNRIIALTAARLESLAQPRK